MLNWPWSALFVQNSKEKSPILTILRTSENQALSLVLTCPKTRKNRGFFLWILEELSVKLTMKCFVKSSKIQRKNPRAWFSLFAILRTSENQALVKGDGLEAPLPFKMTQWSCYCIGESVCCWLEKGKSMDTWRRRTHNMWRPWVQHSNKAFTSNKGFISKGVLFFGTPCI